MPRSNPTIFCLAQPKPTAFIDATTTTHANIPALTHSRLFAAGDCRRNQSLVVWAINKGRAAAHECDRFLMGTTQLP